jgi:superfamily II DNA or RNA helicase
MPNPTDFSTFLTQFQSPKFRSLRPAQADVLHAYNSFLGNNDIGIELPTGGGKTLIALLISEL